MSSKKRKETTIDEVNIITPRHDKDSDLPDKPSFLVRQLMSGGAGGKLTMECESGKIISWKMDECYELIIDEEERHTEEKKKMVMRIQHHWNKMCCSLSEN